MRLERAFQIYEDKDEIEKDLVNNAAQMARRCSLEKFARSFELAYLNYVHRNKLLCTHEKVCAKNRGLLDCERFRARLFRSYDE